MGNWYFAILILLALLSCARGLLASRSAAARWTVYLLVCPLIAGPTFLFDRPYYDLMIGLLALSCFADRLATHALFTATCDALPRLRRRARLAWRNRYALLDSTERRVPFYLLAVLMPVWLLVIVMYRRHSPVRYLFADDLLVVLGAIAIGVVVSLLLEPLVSFLLGRTVRGPLYALKLVRIYLWDWATANIRDRTMPGLFVSPAGTARRRLDLLFGVMLLLAVPLTELSFYSRMFYPGDETASEQEDEPSNEVVLQPYQEALLAKMTPDEREQFLRRVGEQTAAGEDAPRTPWFDFTGPRSQQEFNDQQIQITYLGFLAGAGPFWAHFLSLIPPLILTPVVFVLGVLPALGRAAAAADDAGGGEPADQPLDEARWEQFVTQLQNGNQTERKSFFLGLNAADRSPVIVPRSVFEEHAHFLGDSGSGKTTLGLAPLISQMIRSGDSSVVIIDLTGDDPALLENARIEAAAAGLKFRWFTNELGRSTYAFNPLLQRHLAELSLYQRTDLLTASLGLQYGTDYGRGYFSDANAELLYHALRARPNVGSFVELSQILKQREPFRTVSSQLKMAGAHLSAIVTRLGSTEALNARPGGDVDPQLLTHAIDMRQAFEEPQVIYFHLASALGTATSAEIARMAMFSLLSASKFVTGKRQQVFLVVDEFQRAVSNNLELFLQTARSMNIGVILANQALSDLKKPGVDIVSTVRTNTRSWTTMLGMTLTGLGTVKSENTSQVVSPRLRVNDLLLASDHPLRSVCHVRRGAGFAQYGGMPFVMESVYHISEQEYLDRKQADWPAAPTGTFTPTLESTDPVAYQAPPASESLGAESQASAAAAQRLLAGLDEHFEEQKAARLRATQPVDPPLESD